MKQARRLPLLALDLALLFALFGCAAPGPSASAGRFSAPVYVAGPEFAGLVPLTSRADEFCGLLPLTPSAGGVSSHARGRRRAAAHVAAAAHVFAGNPADWVPSVVPPAIEAPVLAGNPADWVPPVAAPASYAAADPAGPVRKGRGFRRRTTLEDMLFPSLLEPAATFAVSASLAFAGPRYDPDAVAEAFDRAMAQEAAALGNAAAQPAAPVAPGPARLAAAAAAHAEPEAPAAEADDEEVFEEDEEEDAFEGDEDEEEDDGESAEDEDEGGNGEPADAVFPADPADASDAPETFATPAGPAPDAAEDGTESAEDGTESAAPTAEPPAAPAIPWRTETYSLVARAMDLRQVLETFGVAQGISTILSPAVGGALSGEFVEVPCGEFLDRLASLHNLAWYWDGATLWIYAASEMQTILLDLRYMKAGEVRAMLAELGVEDPRFPLKTASRDELIMVSGPPRYVMLVAEMIQKADVLRERRTFTEIETRIFPLQNTWADDVSFNAGSPESSGSIKGVASMLQQIVGKLAAPGAREEGSTNAPTAFQPLITAENRLNAVIVTDVAPRMPLYERLIKELDVPQKLVEIEVTVVELSRKDALDWQLSIAGTGTKDRYSGGAGMNAGNLFDSESVSGRGLAGALTYLGNRATVSASLTALRDKGKARSISRTTLLTVNNLAAELSDRQTYHARVVGAEVAELAEVSAGTTLQIKPRIMRPGSDEAPGRIWLTLSLQDGGFESVSVDSMPMSRSSSLDTQTSVYEDDTIVLAGYLRDIEESAGWGIPLLRDLPLVGWLFGGHSSKTETVQRLFLISPHVVDADAEDLARIQAMRLRDISVAEELQDDAKDLDEVRELRDMDRQERRERREDVLDERLKQRRRELERAREERARLRKEREAELRAAEGRGGCLPW